MREYKLLTSLSTNLIIISFLLNIPAIGIAQDYSGKLKKANKQFDSFSYIDARQIYLDVAEKGYTSQDLYQKLGDAYYLNGELEESIKWYEKLLEEYAESINPEYLFKFAQSLKSIEAYAASDQAMSWFHTKIKGDRRAQLFIEKKDYLDSIDLQSKRFDLFTLNINSKNSEYAPSFNHQNQIIFTSSRGKPKKEAINNGWDGLPFLDLYVANILGDHINLDTPEKLKGNINTKFHESSSCLSPDGETLYFTRNNFTNKRRIKNEEGKVLLKLYKAVLKNKNWADIQELPFSSNEYSVSHPSVSKDGKKLYFSSNMPGSLGSSDIFVVDILPNGKYGTPKNLGEHINTEARETFPFISDSGKLYFSSNGHIGLGGLDIFVCLPQRSQFSKAYNLGKPINSSKDDFSFIINENTKIGYFASNRKGGKGNDDIYGIKQIKELVTSCKQYVRGIIYDNKTNTSLPNTGVTLLDIEGNILSETSTDSEGKYNLVTDCAQEYLIRTSINGFKSREIAFSTDDIFEFVNEISIPLNAIDSDHVLLTATEVKIGDDLSKTLLLKPILFNLDDFSIQPQSEIELQKIISVMHQYPDLKIEVRSHTDSRSSFWYNKQLSVKRMRVTVAYLVEKGNINWRRIRGKAYGERRLFNKCTDNIPCTEEEHLENRRSEFIIVEGGLD